MGAKVFDEWAVFMEQAVNSWRRQQARSLLALVRQLVEEDEPCLSKTSEPYGVRVTFLHTWG